MTMNDAVTVVTGCSYARGIGLDQVSADENLWCNVVHQTVPQLRETRLINRAVSASNNQDIFHATVAALVDQPNCRYLFVAWSELVRYLINPGFENYTTTLFLSANSQISAITVNPAVTMDQTYLCNIRDRFLSLHHPHHEIVKLLRMSATISKLCAQRNITVWFINSLLPWDPGFFDPVITDSRRPSDCTAWTQEILNASTRSDEEFFSLYDRMHRDYDSTGAKPHGRTWPNLDVSMRIKLGWTWPETVYIQVRGPKESLG